MFMGLFGFLLLIVYIAVVVYFFVLFSRLVSAAERISQNIEAGVDAFRESRRQPPAGSA